MQHLMRQIKQLLFCCISPGLARSSQATTLPVERGRKGRSRVHKWAAVETVHVLYVGCLSQTWTGGGGEGEEAELGMGNLGFHLGYSTVRV